MSQLVAFDSLVATIQFEPFNQPVNKVFLVQVTLNIYATAPTAHIVLSGAGASGEADRTILAALRPQAQQFGAVRIWMGFPHTGAFQATNVVVRRK